MQGDSIDDFNFFKIGIWILVFIGYFFLIRYMYPDGKYFFPFAVIHILAFLWFASIGKSVIWRSRAKGYQVTCDGVSGSIYGKPEYVADPSMGKDFHWAVFNLGYSHLPPLRGKLGTLVVPADQVYPAGKNYVGLTLVQKYPFARLPSPVQFFLRRNKGDFNVENVFYGKYSQQFIDNSGVELSLNEQIEAKNSLIGVYQKTIEHDFEHFEEIKEFGDRLTGNKFSIKKLFAKAVKDEDAD